MMNQWRRFFVGLICGIVFLIPTIVSGKALSDKDVLKRAKVFYNAGKYDSTISIIKAYLKDHGKDPATEQIVPLLMEALVRKDDASYFKKLTQIYYKKFPESSFLSRIYYLEGVTLAKEKEYRGSVQSFSAALARGVSDTLSKLIMENVLMVCQRGASADDLGYLREKGKLHQSLLEVVSYYEIRKLADAGQGGKARNLADEFRKNYPQSEYRQDIRKVMNEGRSGGKRAVQVGLLAPVTGVNADIGRAVIQGAQLAVEYHNDMSNQPVDLVVTDTKGSMVETAKKMRELLNDRRTSLFLGPVLSSSATVAAAMLMEKSDAVMITPTATDEGIADLGKNVFQLNVTPAVLARRIARYAVENLRIKEFAIIAPMGDYGKLLSESFKSEVIRLGAEVMDEQFFEEGTNDFKLQFTNMRKNLAEKMWDKKIMEAGGGAVTISPRMKELYLSDSTIQVGGLFVPAAGEDATKIASQVLFHRIRTQLLGANGWHSTTVLNEGKRYVEDAVFSTNFQVDVGNQRWIAFSKEYTSRYKEAPDRVVAPLAYDAAMLLLEALGSDDDPQAIGEYLRKVKGYKGISGQVTFDNSNGVNSETVIMKISNKKFIQIN